ncbi:MAG TPA: hypothetical protein VJJ02_04290 [Candidatus Paceibacterota bacterium]
MKKKAPKNQASKKEYSGNDVKRYLGALSEDFQHKVSAIGEQFGGLNKKLDDHGRILNEHSRILNEHGRILNTHTQMIGKLMVDVNVMKGDIQEIKTDLKQKVDRGEFARLEKRVLMLESREYTGRSRK